MLKVFVAFIKSYWQIWQCLGRSPYVPIYAGKLSIAGDLDLFHGLKGQDKNTEHSSFTSVLRIAIVNVFLGKYIWWSPFN